MENIQNMQNQQMTDAELEQVAGGRNLWDAVRAQFFDSDEDPKVQNLLMKEDKDAAFGVTTLEMRTDPKKKKQSKTIRL